MGDACCGGDDQPGAPGAEAEEREPERLWEVSELRAAAVAGVLLVAALATGWADGPQPVVLGLEVAALLVGGWTFVPSTLRRLARGRIGVGTLMTIAAVGAVLLGEVGEAAALAFLYSVSEGLEEYSLARTRRGLRALLSLVPERATVLRGGAQVVVAAAETLLAATGNAVALCPTWGTGATCEAEETGRG